MTDENIPDGLFPKSLRQQFPIRSAYNAIREDEPLPVKEIFSKIDYIQPQLFVKTLNLLCEGGYVAFDAKTGSFNINRILKQNPRLFIELREKYKLFGGSIGVLAHPSNYNPEGAFSYVEHGNKKTWNMGLDYYLDMTKSEGGEDMLERTMMMSCKPPLTDDWFSDTLTGEPNIDFYKFL